MHKISYTTDGLTCEFDFTFPFFQSADIHVCLDEVSQSSDTYSVVENPNFDGGRVVFATPPTAGLRLDIFRRVSLERVIDYQPTSTIDPEHLNADFNFLLSAFQDIYSANVDLTEWQNTHQNVVEFLQYTNDVISDKLAGGGVLGLYRNLLTVLDGALPKLINDYGTISEPAIGQYADDYGIL